MIISLASGKGGVGKTMLAAGMATAAARRGLRVCLVDLDVGGADAHLVLGELSSRKTLTDFLTHKVESLADVALPCKVDPNLRLIAGTGETLRTANLTYSSKRRLARHINKIDADMVVLDVGAGTNFHALDFFLMGERRVVVATPEPTSVMDAYKFVKLASVRHVLSSFLARDEISKTLTQRDFQTVAEILSVASEIDESAREKVQRSIAGFTVSLIINQVSASARLNVAKLAGVMREFVGGKVEMLGMIPSDPAVVRAVSRCRPVLLDSPTAPVSLAITRLVDEVLASDPEADQSVAG